MLDLLIGLVMGYLGLFFPNARVLNMIAGNRAKAVFYHVFASAMWAISIYKAAQLNLYFIIGNMIGGAVAIYYLTNKQRKQK